MLTREKIRDTFSATFYNRGLQYYKQGRVQDLTYSALGDDWSAYVTGSEIYRVKIAVDDDFFLFELQLPGS